MEMAVTAAVRGSRGCPYAPTLGVYGRPWQEESLSVDSPRDGDAKPRPFHTPCSGSSFPPGKIIPVALLVDKTVTVLKDSKLKEV